MSWHFWLWSHDHWIFYKDWFLRFVTTELFWRYAMWKGETNWLITADNCKQMLLLEKFHKNGNLYCIWSVATMNHLFYCRKYLFTLLCYASPYNSTVQRTFFKHLIDVLFIQSVFSVYSKSGICVICIDITTEKTFKKYKFIST